MKGRGGAGPPPLWSRKPKRAGITPAPTGLLALSEDEPRLQLEHARRVYVCERRDGVRGRADAGHELAERRGRCRAIAVGCDAAAEHVRVIEQVEALPPEQEARALR